MMPGLSIFKGLVMHSEHYFESADGLRLFYRQFDAQSQAQTSAVPILCLHGLTRNSRDFTDVATHLASTHRVIVPDVRGRGFSAYDPEPEHYQPGFYAQDMWALLDHLAIERCVIIGTSMGGVIAMIMALQQPQRIAGIVLNDIGPELEEAGLQRIASYVGERTDVRNWDDAAALCKRINETALPDYSPADWLQFARNTFREDAQGIPRADYDPAIALMFQQVDGKDAAEKAWQVFNQLRQPMLVLRGAISDLLSAEIVEKMRARHPDLTAVEIPRRGHAPMLDEAESLAAIAAFLQRIR